jgi:hypothetical protein
MQRPIFGLGRADFYDPHGYAVQPVAWFACILWAGFFEIMVGHFSFSDKRLIQKNK